MGVRKELRCAWNAIGGSAEQGLVGIEQSVVNVVVLIGWMLLRLLLHRVLSWLSTHVGLRSGLVGERTLLLTLELVLRSGLLSGSKRVGLRLVLLRPKRVCHSRGVSLLLRRRLLVAHVG